ncbi:contractile injection system protein, VgrG/Pvc8 family [Roseospira marina]|uniref:contractile injection system protein, VgrG/Pvc8 family n=1 Tax=Roseospira marina TaxID=140057 RepID=UPI001478443F|nr:contractile injection system protein, VgrG/Pvc8 family [Roseospira marina]MBB4315823.1 hypothetical protein [Roseospira marina]MBB5089037.1 hypothetical protein [Roseospira marina]
MIPAWRVTADAVDVTAAVAAGLLSLTVTDKPGLDSDELTLAIADPTGSLTLPRRGVILRVALGWQGSPLIDKGRYRVDEVRHAGPPDRIEIKARAADLTGGLRAHRDESYDETTLGAVLQAVASRHGLAPAIAASLASLPIPHLDQATESDAHLVTRLAQQVDAIGTIKDGRLVFTPRGAGVTAEGATLPAVTVARTETASHAFGIQDREGETTGVRAVWRDHDAAEDRAELAGASGTVTTLRRVYPSQAEAAAAARAALTDIARGQRDLRLSLAFGRPEIIAGQPLAVTGFRPEMDGVQWVVETVRHTLDAAGGFRSDIEAVEQQPPAQRNGSDSGSDGGSGGGSGGAAVDITSLRESGVDWSGLSAAERAERAGA